ncbi:MAG TPA: hypothetical protein VMZ30_03045 [Pyrinomonadaceae bacterium]|nr:hypothetical protein [Pyrinomonadaceae bacterium]
MQNPAKGAWTLEERNMLLMDGALHYALTGGFTISAIPWTLNIFLKSFL